MKNRKILTAVGGLVLSFALAFTQQVKAEWVEKKPDAYGMQLFYSDQIEPGKEAAWITGAGTADVSFSSSDATKTPGVSIGNVKSSSKNLVVKVTYNNNHTNTYGTSKSEYNGYTIGYYAKKKGTYTVSFKVYDKDKKALETVKFKVKAKHVYDPDIKSVKYAGKYLYKSVDWTKVSEDYESPAILYTNKKSGKLQVKMGKKCKIKKIEITTYAKNGIKTVKTVKNNKKIKITTAVGGTETYKTDYSDYSYDMTRSPLFGQTDIKIYYTRKGKKYTNEDKCDTSYYTIYYKK